MAKTFPAKTFPAKTFLARALLAKALLCCVPAGAATPGQTAALKLEVHLDAATIKVGDLWANAGARKDIVIGPAPAPGRTIAIGATQLAYIARLYDVGWRPVSGVEQTSLERLGRPLTREEMAEPLRRSLVEAGAGAQATVEFSNFAPVQVPPAAFPVLSVEGIAYDQEGDRFSANLAVAAEGMETLRMRVSGRVLQMVTAVVANRRLQPGDVIGPGDVRAAQVAERRLPGPVLSDVDAVIGQSPKRAITAGQPVSAADIGPPVLVAKGDTVVVVMETPSIYLASQGVALSRGGRDDVIQVMNPLSRAVVAARITGPGRAVVAPGSSPLVAPALAAASMPRIPEVSN